MTNTSEANLYQKQGFRRFRIVTAVVLLALPGHFALAPTASAKEVKEAKVVKEKDAVASSKDSSAAVKPAWTKQMRKMADTLNDLLVDLSSDTRYNSPKNFKRIEKNAQKIAKIAHDIKFDKAMSPDQDPSIRIIGGLFAQEADHAYKTLAWGHRAYAREKLRALTSYCIACHTRDASGPSFGSQSVPPKLEGFKEIDKAQYFASIRQYDRALDDFEKILSQADRSDKYSIEWEQSARSALALAIRVKNDPDRALKIVNEILSAPKAPYFFKEQATSWKESIVKWKAEAPHKAQTEEGLYAEAIRLIAAARKTQQYPADRSADVLYLRASRTIHELLSLAPEGRHSTEALYLAGLSYEVLNGLDLWGLHELYYLACIYKEPHTPIARQCYRHYEESVYAGYSGSGGTFLPDEIRVKLVQLDLLSSPVNDKKVPPLLQ